MFCTVESEPRFTNCPRCESTNTFLSAFSNKSYCVNCRKLYDKIDGALLRKQLMTFLKEEDVLKYEFFLRDYLTRLDSMLKDRAELKRKLKDSPAGKYLKKMEIYFEESQKRRKEAEQKK